MKRGLIIAALPLLLGGCLPILPPAIQLATTGLSGIAFLATGKSTSDHLISAAVDEDCSLMRVAFGSKPCQEYTSDDQKPLTEIVAYYPGDGDDWIDPASIPKGEVSGRSMLATSVVGDPDVRGRNSWPGEPEADVLLVEAPAGNEDGRDATNAIEAGLEPIKDLSVAGFVPVMPSLEPKPLKLKSAAAPSVTFAPPVADDVSWTVEPQPRVASVMPATDPDPVKVETAAPARMTVLPIPRPARHVPGDLASKAPVDPSETFSESGLFATAEAPREPAGMTLLSDALALNQDAAPAPPPVIMSVRLKGSLLHRVAGGAFARYDTVAATSSLEPVFGLTR